MSPQRRAWPTHASSCPLSPGAGFTAVPAPRGPGRRPVRFGGRLFCLAQFLGRRGSTFPVPGRRLWSLFSRGRPSAAVLGGLGRCPGRLSLPRARACFRARVLFAEPRRWVRVSVSRLCKRLFEAFLLIAAERKTQIDNPGRAAGPDDLNDMRSRRRPDIITRARALYSPLGYRLCWASPSRIGECRGVRIGSSLGVGG